MLSRLLMNLSPPPFSNRRPGHTRLVIILDRRAPAGHLVLNRALDPHEPPVRHGGARLLKKDGREVGSPREPVAVAWDLDDKVGVVAGHGGAVEEMDSKVVALGEVGEFAEGETNGQQRAWLPRGRQSLHKAGVVVGHGDGELKDVVWCDW